MTHRGATEFPQLHIWHLGPEVHCESPGLTPAQRSPAVASSEDLLEPKEYEYEEDAIGRQPRNRGKKSQPGRIVRLTSRLETVQGKLDRVQKEMDEKKEREALEARQ